MRRLGPAIAVRDFRLAWLGSSARVSLQMLEVAIGWEVYAQHRSALDLGWIGLAEFVPMFVLALPAGQLADRLPRRAVFASALLLGAGVGIGLAIVSAGTTGVPVPGAGRGRRGDDGDRVTGGPRDAATLVPVEMLQSAMTLRTIGTQLGRSPGRRSAACSTGCRRHSCTCSRPDLRLGASVLAMIRRPAADVPSDCRRPALPRSTACSRGCGSSVHPVLLGAILLDLLAVLFGGAVALLPVFARSILHVGPTGLGVLRAAPAVGALVAAAVVTRRPSDHAGRPLLIVVGLFGASIIVFGFSRSYLLSLVALGISGGVDLYSMNIRATTVALATPDRLRGRVNAVEMVFISASNQLGAFESGVGGVPRRDRPAVVAGGVITIGIALSWGAVFPALARSSTGSPKSSPWTPTFRAPRPLASRPACYPPGRVPAPPRALPVDALPRGPGPRLPDELVSAGSNGARAPRTPACSPASW